MCLCMHVCLCMWKFEHLMCVLISVVPDLRAGLMGLTLQMWDFY